MTWIRCSLLAVCVALLCTSCAYYNLFYNAEQAYQKAEDDGKDIDPRNQPTGGQKSQYRICIRKCLQFLEEYPDSGYVDDALFLSGKAYYHLKEVRNYRLALRSFDNVLSNFPNSDLTEETLYFKSLTHLALGEEQLALDSFARLRESYPEGEFSARATYRLADTYAERDEPETALSYYEQFMRENPDDDESAAIGLRYGRSLLLLERYEEAIELYATVQEHDPSNRQAFLAQFNTARALNSLDRFEEAAALMPEIVDEAQFFGQRGQALLLQGSIQMNLGEEEQAIELLEAIAAEFERKDVEGLARLRLANYYVKNFGPGDKRAADHLATAVDHGIAGEVGPRIKTLRRSLAAFLKLRDELALADSLSHVKAFELGELLLMRLERPDLALPLYERSLRESPEDGALQPRAAFAVGYIHEQYLDHPDSAAAVFAMIEANYPESVQARALAGEEFLEAKPRVAAASTGFGGRDTAGTGLDAGLPGRSRGTRGGALVPTSLQRGLRVGGPGALYPRSGVR